MVLKVQEAPEMFRSRSSKSFSRRTEGLPGSHRPHGRAHSKAARELTQEHKKRLKQIRNLLDSKPAKLLVGEVRQPLEVAFGTFAKTLDQQVGQQEKEIKPVMAIIAVIAAGRSREAILRPLRGIGKKRAGRQQRRRVRIELRQARKPDIAADRALDEEPAAAPKPPAGRSEADQAIEARRCLDRRLRAAFLASTISPQLRLNLASPPLPACWIGSRT